MNWEEHQSWEQLWHGNCVDAELGERLKHITYASRMGLKMHHDGKSPYNIDCKGQKILDIGGGPYSLLLMVRNGTGVVVDPCEYPEWVRLRYATAGITVYKQPAEVPLDEKFDEAWIYNCLQHTQDPEKIIANARACSKLIRIFEWIECGTSPGHPWELTEAALNLWLGGHGKVERVNENNAVGKAYYGIFPT